MFKTELTMRKPLFLLVLFFSFSTLFAQYTETINSDRPGESQGAFAVGTQVLQLEAGGKFGSDEHDLLNTETNQFGVDYALRYGIFLEQLEINIRGTYLNSEVSMPVGGLIQENSYANFESNTIGVKYLAFDPFKHLSDPKANLYSWKANNTKFKWRDLIPAVAVYAGLNVLSDDNPYLPPGQDGLSPKFAAITQHNWGRWVFVTNLIADMPTSDFPSYAGIFTLTHSINGRYSVFGEYQAIKSDFYADNIARLGGAFLLTKNLQFDLSGLINFKDTPSRWKVAMGVSYRLDMHSEDEIIIKNRNDKKKEEEEKDIEIDAQPE